MNLAWVYKHSWAKRYPSFGGDERWRTTLVIPWPFNGKKDEDDSEDDTLWYSALVIVISPWWLTRFALNKEFRTYVRWERNLHDILSLIPEDASDEEFDKYLDPMYDIMPEFPKVLL